MDPPPGGQLLCYEDEFITCTERGICPMIVDTDNFQKHDIRVYPNPSTDILYIGSVSNAKLEVIDINARY